MDKPIIYQLIPRLWGNTCGLPVQNGSLDENGNKGMIEGSKWTYLFCVLQDVPGLVELMGGPEAFAAKLDENFEGGHYRHDNEPGHQYCPLTIFAGQKMLQQLQ